MATAVYATPYASHQSSDSPETSFGFEARSQQLEAEEEKEEITGLADLPTAGVADFAETATVIRNGDDEDYDEEMARMKRAAYYGHQHDIVPDREPQPEPLPSEDFAAFYARTIDHWNVWAAERLTGSGKDLTIDTLEDESTRMASRRWQEMQPAMNAEATVISISEGDVHPADLGAIRAEWVRYGTATPTAAVTTTEPQGVVGHHQHTNAVMGSASGTAVATTVEDSIATEATVIDTAPLAKEEGREAWQTAEEAQVLLENVAPEAEHFEDHDQEERKPPASTSQTVRQQFFPSDFSTDIMDQRRQQSDEYAVADQEAVVLAIEDDVHPADFARDDANAEVVGADFAYPVSDDRATSDSGRQTSITATVDTQVTGGGTSSPAEVQAVLVGSNSASEYATVAGTPAVANITLEGSQTVAVSVY